MIAALVLIPVSFLPSLLWHDRQQFQKRDAALTLPLLVLLSFAILLLSPFSGSLAFPLRDAAFVAADRALGFDVASIVGWSATHPAISHLLSSSYDLLPYLLLAAIASCGFGDKLTAWKFLGANVVAELIAFPLFVLLPAVGPWLGYGFPANAAQRACESSVWMLRAGQHGDIAGIICFPSFHVIWAILSALALWQSKALRIPAAILAALISISTLTTGWHYAVDSFAGILIAALSWKLASIISRRIE